MAEQRQFGPVVMRAPVTLEDLTADLVWPRLLRAAALAFNPSRLGLGFLTVAVIMVGLELSRAIGAGTEAAAEGAPIVAAPGTGRPGVGEIALAHLAEVAAAVVSLDPLGTASAVVRAFTVMPMDALRVSPVGAILAAVLAILAAAVGGGAISRMCAAEFAVGMSVPWPQAVAFAIRRLGSLVGALLGPVLVVWVVLLLLALFGVLLRAPVLNVVAALLYGPALLLGLIGMLVMIAFVAGKPLLIPAVTCDGADAIDAIQRAYAYVFGRPLRLLAYAAVLLIEALLIFFVVLVVAWGVVGFTSAAAGTFAGESGRDVLASVGAPETATAERLGAMGAAAAWIIRLWTALVAALVGGYIVSFYFCASTLLYLAMRRVVDGQDMHEIWLPGMVPGTLAEPAEPAAEEATGPGVRKDWVE